MAGRMPPASDDDDSGDEKKAGTRRVSTQFIEDKSKRQITFSKRKTGIMKKVRPLLTIKKTRRRRSTGRRSTGVVVWVAPALRAESNNFFRSLICTGDPRNPAACGTHQGTWEKKICSPYEGWWGGRRARLAA